MPNTLLLTAHDLTLEYIQDNVDGISICSSQPTTRTEAHSTYRLAGATVTSGEFTIEDDNVSGRKIIIPEKADLLITSSGKGQFVALYSATELIVVAICHAHTLTADGVNVVTIPAWAIKISDP